MISLPILKEGDPISAAQFNEYADAINTTWAMQVDDNFRLTKSEPWKLEYLGSPFFTTGGPFNAPIYRVFVDRGDGWDFGSTDDPRAFYLAGTFTSFGGKTAMRAAKFYKDPATGRTVFSKSFARLNQFNGTTNNVITTRDGGAVIYYSTQPKSRNGGASGYAWLIDPTTEDLVTSGFNLVASADFSGGTVAYLSCVSGYLCVNSFLKLHTYDLTTGAYIEQVSTINVHNTAGDSQYLYAGSQIAQFPGQDVYGYIEPKGVKKFLVTGAASLDSTWQTNGGGGTSVPCFNMILTQKQIWNGTYDPVTGGPKVITTVATREYGGSGGYHWDGDTFANPGTGEGAVFRLTADALLYNPAGIYEADFTFTLDSSVAGCSPRAELFFNDPDDNIWFGGGVSRVNPVRDAPQTVTPQRLYKFSFGTQSFDAFDGFNGPVRHAAFFCEGPTQGRQFIVVGDFTEYNGEPAEYIMFMDGGGNRLDDLEWP